MATPNYEDWVINLAERLVSGGVDVVIVKWNLKEGLDKFNFMETIATELGYDDYPYFSRLFTKAVGISALAFRNKNHD